MPELLKELEDVERAMAKAEQFETLHKNAFRKAFEFLKRQFPPRADGEYWLKAARDLGDTSGTEPENVLLGNLLLCVWEYLDKTQKEQERHE